MSYSFEALVAPKICFQEIHLIDPDLPFFVLPQDFGMIPLDDIVYEKVLKVEKDHDCDEEDEESLWGHPQKEVAKIAKMLSKFGKVAHIEISCWGGEGVHAGTVWEKGELIFGPFKTLSGGHYGPELSELPSNQALRKIGVRKEKLDEFEALGLGRNRCMEEWLERSEEELEEWSENYLKNEDKD